MNKIELPQEIADHIIDHLWNDKHALGTCSLVCKAWSLCARHHLFANVVITDSNSGTMVTLGPAVARCIRNVTLTWQSAPRVPSFLKALIGLKFENAVSLALGTFFDTNLDNFETSHNLTPHIVNLRILNLTARTADHFTKFVCAFRCLETLAVKGLRYPTATLPSGSQLALPDTLRVVKFLDDRSMRWLLSFQHLPPIHTVDGIVSDVNEDDMPVSDLLRMLGASLETVCLTCRILRGMFSCHL